MAKVELKCAGRSTACARATPASRHSRPRPRKKRLNFLELLPPGHRDYGLRSRAGALRRQPEIGKGLCFQMRLRFVEVRHDARDLVQNLARQEPERALS